MKGSYATVWVVMLVLNSINSSDACQQREAQHPQCRGCYVPLSSEYGTHKTVTAILARVRAISSTKVLKSIQVGTIPQRRRSAREGAEREVSILLPNNQRQHRTLHFPKDVLPSALS